MVTDQPHWTAWRRSFTSNKRKGEWKKSHKHTSRWQCVCIYNMHYPGREQVPACPGIACVLKILGKFNSTDAGNFANICFLNYQTCLKQPIWKQTKPKKVILCVFWNKLSAISWIWIWHNWNFTFWFWIRNVLTKPVHIWTLLCTIVRVARLMQVYNQKCVKMSFHSQSYTLHHVHLTTQTTLESNLMWPEGPSHSFHHFAVSLSDR